MRKILSLVITTATFLSAAEATWEGEYEFDNGAKVIRRPTHF